MSKQHKKLHKPTQQKTQTPISTSQTREKEQIVESISSPDSPFHFWFKLLGASLGLLLTILYCGGRAYRNAYFYRLGLDEGTYPYSTQDYTYKGFTANLIPTLVLLFIFCSSFLFVNINKNKDLPTKKLEKIIIIASFLALTISVLVSGSFKDMYFWNENLQNISITIQVLSFMVFFGAGVYYEVPQIVPISAFLLIIFGTGLCINAERKGTKDAKLQKELITKPEDPTLNSAFHLPKVTITLPIQTNQLSDNQNKTVESPKTIEGYQVICNDKLCAVLIRHNNEAKMIHVLLTNVNSLGYVVSPKISNQSSQNKEKNLVEPKQNIR